MPTTIKPATNSKSLFRELREIPGEFGRSTKETWSELRNGRRVTPKNYGEETLVQCAKGIWPELKTFLSATFSRAVSNDSAPTVVQAVNTPAPVLAQKL